MKLEIPILHHSTYTGLHVIIVAYLLYGKCTVHNYAPYPSEVKITNHTIIYTVDAAKKNISDILSLPPPLPSHTRRGLTAPPIF